MDIGRLRLLPVFVERLFERAVGSSLGKHLERVGAGSRQFLEINKAKKIARGPLPL
jgi:hypothetical protein